MLDHLEEQIKALSPEDRAALLARLAPSTTIVFCGSSVISYGSAVQINGTNSEDLSKIIEKIPPEALGEIVKAIGVRIANHKV